MYHNLKMMRLSSVSQMEIQNLEEFELEEIEGSLKNKKIPEFNYKQIYKVGFFDFQAKHRFRRIELTILATKGQTDLMLINKDNVNLAKREGFKYMHIGAI